MAQAPLLDTIVVSYQSRDLLRACLASLQRHQPSAGGMAVHVVDNASTDGTADMVASDFPGVALTALTRNTGFSTANNLVLRESRAPYALLLNPDTEVTEGALDRMLATMAECPDAAVGGCRLVRPDGTFDHAAKRGFPTPLSALAHFTRVGRAGRRLGQYRAPELGERDVGEVDAVNGAFMLVRRDAMERVGLLDEGYWLYMEDLDWCYRFKRAGYRVLYDGRATVLHVKGASSGSHRALRQNAAFHKGMGRFYRKFYAGPRPALDALVYLGIGAKLVVSAVRSAVARRGLS